MKRAQRTDFFRELKKSLNRYLSILLITALGVAFYAGVRSSEPDMQLTAKEFYDETDFFDIRVIGTMGLTEEDVAAVKAVDGVDAAEGAFQTELYLLEKDKNYQMTIYSLMDRVNRVKLEEGRLPERENECFMDSFFFHSRGYHLGDTVTLAAEDGTEFADVLNGDTYTIVGYGTYAAYLSWNRGTVSIGTGAADAYLFLPKSAFASEVYTSIYATVRDAAELNCFLSEYEDLITEKKDAVKELEAVRCQARFDEVTAPYKDEIAENRQKIEDGKQELSEAESELQKGQEQFDAARAQLEAFGLPMPEEMMVRQMELKEAERVLTEKKQELSEAEEKLADAETELKKLELPEWYVLGRDTVQSFVEYGMDTERIGKIGQVFPAVFYLVATLVALTTMTRMVEEERTQIGTMKALGYGKGSIAGKYVWYSLSASLIGGVLGVCLGSYILPQVIIGAYKILYAHLPDPVTPIQRGYAVISILIAVFCTVAATLFACYKELLATPAILMRPAAPKEGKRVFLEYVTFVWKHLSFSWKATVRNLFRYKKRFFMTIFGIGGCMALLMVGFGLMDSIGSIVDNQYKKLWTYDASLSVKDCSFDATNIAHGNLIDRMMYVRQATATIEAKEQSKEIHLFVPETLDNLDDFLKLKSRTGKEVYHLSEDGVLLSEKLARILEVKAGDTIDIMIDEVTGVPVKVTAVSENYLYNYVYMSAKQYEEVFGKPVEFNQLFLKLHEMTEGEKEAFSREVMADASVDTISYVADLQKRVADMMNSLNLVVVVLIISAALLAFIVLYNLNNINIIERRRELATIRVLGFYDGEMAAYVYRENILLTIIGIAVGVVIGIFLHRFVIETCEIDMIMFGRDIKGMSYLYSIALTCVFSVAVNLFMIPKLKRIDMVESLKSAE